MQSYIDRLISNQISRKLNNIPAVAILGPRQCGKSTLAKHMLKNYPNSIYLDLERTSDINKLRDPETFFTINHDTEND